MKVSDLMTKEVKACHPHDSLNRAAQLMWENDCGAIPVIDSDAKVIGMLTDRDICMAAYTKGIALVEASAASVMSRNVSVCNPGDNISTATERMREHQIRRLPVVDEKEQSGRDPVGQRHRARDRATARGQITQAPDQGWRIHRDAGRDLHCQWKRWSIRRSMNEIPPSAP